MAQNVSGMKARLFGGCAQSESLEDTEDAERDGRGGDKINNVKQIEEVAAMLSLYFVHARGL